MKSSIFSLVIFLSFWLMVLNSCSFGDDNINCIEGKGSLVTQELMIDPFIGIEVIVPSNTRLVQGAEQKVVVTGQQNIIDLIEKNVAGGNWRIELAQGCYDEFSLAFEITLPELNKVSILSPANVQVEDFEEQGDMLFEVAGSGDLDVGAIGGTENLLAGISGSGNINCLDDFPDLKNLEVRIAGSGNYEGYAISTDKAILFISGSGNIKATVRDELQAIITGSGSIFYRGNPTVSENISGSGEVVDGN